MHAGDTYRHNLIRKHGKFVVQMWSWNVDKFVELLHKRAQKHESIERKTLLKIWENSYRMSFNVIRYFFAQLIYEKSSRGQKFFWLSFDGF